MSHPHAIAPKPKCTPCVGFLLLGLVLLVVVSGWILKVVEKVVSGSGMEHCCSIEGIPFSYLAIFVLLCGVTAAFLVVLVLQIRNWLLRRDFERKYGVKVSTSTGEPARYSSSDYGPSLHGYEHHDGD
jgi:hypothetical protein